MFDVVDTNWEPNQRFFIKLSDTGSQMRVEFFNTLADAQAGTNQVGSADVDFGTAVSVTLTPGSTEPAYGEPLAKFNTALAYHLKADGTDGDATRILAIGPFTDLAPIEDPLMLTEQMIQDRATLEINKGTHSRLVRAGPLDSHYPALNEGEIVTITSTKRGLSAVRNRIESIVIEASIDEQKEIRFHDTLEVIEFKDFVRQ